MQEQQMQECFAIEELKQFLTQSPETVIIIDVRSPEVYQEMHIPDAINIPLGELRNRTKEFKKDTVIITACGKGGGRSADAAALLKQTGFTDAKYLCGGTLGWFYKCEI